jgi:hypothetical protein
MKTRLAIIERYHAALLEYTNAVRALSKMANENLPEALELVNKAHHSCEELRRLLATYEGAQDSNV